AQVGTGSRRVDAGALEAISILGGGLRPRRSMPGSERRTGSMSAGGGGGGRGDELESRRRAKVIMTKMITLAEGDHAKNGAPVRKERSRAPKGIMQTGMVVRNHSANDWGRRERSGQAGTGLPAHSRAVNVESLGTRLPNMLTSGGGLSPEK